MFDKEYVFHGKHADIVKRLTNPLGPDVDRSLFRTNYDVYRIAPIIGYLYGRRSSIDKGESNTKIFRDKMMDESEDLKFNYRILMMLTNKDKPMEDRVKIAFKMDNDDVSRAEYDNLYNEYVLGGIEVLEEHIFTDAVDVDDYLMNLYKFLDEFNNRYYADLGDEL